MRVLTTIDTIWFIVVLPASLTWTSHISYDTVASLLRTLIVCAVLMCLYSIATDYNGPLEAPHSYTDDDRYDDRSTG